MALSEEITALAAKPTSIISNARIVVLHSPSVCAPTSDGLPIADDPPVPAVNHALTCGT